MEIDAGERGEHFIMKKKIAMLLAAALCMGTFAGCGNSASNDSSAADNNTTDNTVAATEGSDATASADNVKIDTLNVYFVPSRDPDEIVTATEPLANLMQTELAGLGYDIGEVKITVGTTFEAVGEALAAGTADVGFIPGGTYVLYDDGADVILTATRDGLNKDSIKQLKKFATSGTCEGGCNMIEVMCCEGGCVAGNSTINNTRTAQKLIKELLDNSEDISKDVE